MLAASVGSLYLKEEVLLFRCEIIINTSDRPNFGIVGTQPNRTFGHSLSESSAELPNQTKLENST